MELWWAWASATSSLEAVDIPEVADISIGRLSFAYRLHQVDLDIW
jgi:hypothetical protein